MLRDQLIERVANTRIRDRLLLEADLTLAKATTMALQIEVGQRNADVLSSDVTAASVRAIHKEPRGSRQREKRKPASSSASPAAQTTGTRRSCY